MKLSNATPITVSRLWADLEPKSQQTRFLEESAQELTASVHNQFQESVVLARLFTTVPLEDLPSNNRSFVEKLAESAGAAADMKGNIPILSLIGTCGQEENWKDRHKSEGHVGIPLISAAFVSAIPMISRLIKELGLPLEWLDSHDTESIVQTIGTKAGLFFVENAAEATDQEGRKIIAAQDFVSTYKVKSVFGTGGAYPSGQMVALIVFCRDTIERSVAELFLPLTDLFKGGTVALAETGMIFSDS